MVLVALVLTAALVPAVGAIAAAFTLPLAERWGWGLLPPRLVEGLRAHPHTGSAGLGLYQRAWELHLLYGLVVGASLAVFLPLFFLLPGTASVTGPSTLFLAPFLVYASAVLVVYVGISGCRDLSVLSAVAAGIAAHIGVLVVLLNVVSFILSTYGPLEEHVIVVAELATVFAASLVAVRAKGFHRTPL